MMHGSAQGKQPQARKPGRFVSAASPAGAALLLAGLGLLIYARSLGLAEEGLPGPGLWPACVSVAMALLGASLFLFPAGPARIEKHIRPGREQGKTLAAFSLACLIWMLLLPGAGWILASGLALGLAAWGAGNSPGKIVLLIFGVLGLFYLGFELLMPRSLPWGTLLGELPAPPRPGIPL